jgi:hypothetical protein
VVKGFGSSDFLGTSSFQIAVSSICILVGWLISVGEIIVSALAPLATKFFVNLTTSHAAKGLFACVNIEGAGMGQWQEFGLSILNDLDAAT